MFAILASGLYQHFKKSPRLRKVHGNHHMQFVLFSCVWTEGNMDGQPEWCSWSQPSWCCITFKCNRFNAEPNQFRNPWSLFTTCFSHQKFHYFILWVIFWMWVIIWVRCFVIFRVLRPWPGRWGSWIWDSRGSPRRFYHFEPCIWPSSLKIWLRLVWLRPFILSVGPFARNLYKRPVFDR